MADPTGAQEDARRILSGDRYQAREVPRPLEGVLRWLGDRLRDGAEPLGDLLSTPGGVAVTVAAVLLVTGLLAVGAARRRTRSHEVVAARRRRSGRPDPAALEAEADEAEEAGDLAAAVRLRFRAGVLRLEGAGAVPARADTTSRRLVEAVPSATLADLARTFDAVAYGGRRARPEDVAAARAGWPQVVAEARATGAADGPDRPQVPTRVPA